MSDLDPSVYLDAARADCTAFFVGFGREPSGRAFDEAVQHRASYADFRAAVESAYSAGRQSVKPEPHRLGCRARLLGRERSEPL